MTPTDRHMITHGPGCWSWGPKHYECAVRRIEQLEEALRRYGMHDQTCSAMDIPICTCGLDAALEQEEGK